MKKLPLATAILAGLSLASGPCEDKDLGDLGDGGEPVACTEIGCSDSFGVTVTFNEGRPPAGEHMVRVNASGPVTCRFTVPADIVPSGVFAPCTGGLQVSIIPRTVCTEMTTGAAVSQTCNVIPGQFVQQISFQGTPSQLIVTQYVDDLLLFDRQLQPTYKEVRPNGPKCEPACRQASLIWQLGPVPALARSCQRDDDCARSNYDRPVGSPEDCYCFTCGSTMNKSTAQEFERQFQTHCANWKPAQACIIPPCVPPLPVACVSGRCTERTSP